MIGITLSSEQIRRAPTEVRQWIENEVAASLGLRLEATEPEKQAERLAICSREELAAMLALVQGIFPAVNVFFELGRKGTSFAQDRLEAYRLSDLQHHTRLPSPEQVVSCLDLIEESLHRVRGSTDASFYGVDGDYCFVAAETQQNIRHLWLDLVGRRDIAAREAAETSFADRPASPEPASPGERDRAAAFVAPHVEPAQG